MESHLLITDGWDEYQLVDSGAGRKLERYGSYLIDRPEPQAMWSRSNPPLWKQADAVFTGNDDNDKSGGDNGRWKFKGKPVDTWETNYRGIGFYGRFTPFRHTGFFPEQAPHWDYMTEKLSTVENLKLLNLFGYTGVASLLAADAGAQVTHVDASKKAIGWARENQELAGLADKPIRWICEDARKFTAREGRRQKKYNGILIDPPKFGRGANNEVWNLFEDLPEMLTLTKDIIEDNGFIILTAYAIRASHIALHELCADIFGDRAREISSGELAIRGENNGRCVPTSLYCRIVL